MMRIGNLVYHIVSTSISLFFILTGFVGLILPWSPKVQAFLITFVTKHSITLFLFGFCLLVIGLCVLINQYLVSKHRYYHLRLGNHMVQIDANVIQGYLTEYWCTLFPKRDIPSHVEIKNNEIQITVDFPSLSITEQRKLLEKIDLELSELFLKTFGYRNDFVLLASFANQ